MKKFIATLVLIFICGVLVAQNITNTLPSNGNYIIKDATNVFFTLQQSDGHVAIGSTTFDATNPEQLKVDAGVTTSKNLISGYGTINSYLQLNIQNRSNGTGASSDLVATNDAGNESKGFLDMGINSSNYYDAGYTIGGKSDAYIYCVGNTGGTTVGGNLSIGTVSANSIIKFHTGGTTSDKEKMRIDKDGNVGIGTQNPGVYKLYVSGNCYATQFFVPSDIRLKHDVQPLSDALNNIIKMRGVSFVYNSDETGKKQIGFVAQELEEIYPELVTTNADGFKAVSYANLTAVLLEGIKEQETKIDSQNNKIENLETRLKAIEQKSPSSLNAGIGGTENSNTGFWIFLSAIVLTVGGYVIKRKKQ